MAIIKNYRLNAGDNEENRDGTSSPKVVMKNRGPSHKVIKGVSISNQKLILNKVKEIEVNPNAGMEEVEPISFEDQFLDTEPERDEPVHVQKVVNPTYTPPEIDEEELQKDIIFKQKQAEMDIQNYRQQNLSDIDRQKREALDAAYKEGIEKGKKAGEAMLKERAQEMLQTINSVVADKNKVLRNARGEILRLAMKIAEQILKSEISLNQAVCVNIVSEAISKITDKDKVIIRVNRADADFVRANRERIMTHMSDIKNLVIQEDARIEQGGCIIETKLGYIDSTISTKLESIEKAIFKVYAEEKMEEDGII